MFAIRAGALAVLACSLVHAAPVKENKNAPTATRGEFESPPFWTGGAVNHIPAKESTDDDEIFTIQTINPTSTADEIFTIQTINPTETRNPFAKPAGWTGAWGHGPVKVTKSLNQRRPAKTFTIQTINPTATEDPIFTIETINPTARPHPKDDDQIFTIQTINPKKGKKAPTFTIQTINPTNTDSPFGGIFGPGPVVLPTPITTTDDEGEIFTIQTINPTAVPTLTKRGKKAVQTVTDSEEGPFGGIFGPGPVILPTTTTEGQIFTILPVNPTDTDSPFGGIFGPGPVVLPTPVTTTATDGDIFTIQTVVPIATTLEKRRKPEETFTIQTINPTSTSNEIFTIQTINPTKTRNPFKKPAGMTGGWGHGPVKIPTPTEDIFTIQTINPTARPGDDDEIFTIQTINPTETATRNPLGKPAGWTGAWGHGPVVNRPTATPRN